MNERKEGARELPENLRGKRERLNCRKMGEESGK